MQTKAHGVPGAARGSCQAVSRQPGAGGMGTVPGRSAGPPLRSGVRAGEGRGGSKPPALGADAWRPGCGLKAGWETPVGSKEERELRMQPRGDSVVLPLSDLHGKHNGKFFFDAGQNYCKVQMLQKFDLVLNRTVKLTFCLPAIAHGM